MKTKKLFLMAAMLLMSVCTFAQSETPLKGDVNGDGKVDVADIVAVIEIMKNNDGTTETKYYWYIGQTNPSTMTSISPIVTDMTSPGWRLIGTTLPTYRSSSSSLLSPPKATRLSLVSTTACCRWAGNS